MADEAARRRELRRRRILENAEERKKKIFGTTILTEADAKIENDKLNATVLQDATPSPLTNTSLKEEEEEGSVHNVPLIQDTRTPPTFNTPQAQNSVGFERRELHDNESDHRSPPNFRAENGIESVPEITEHLRNINNLITSGGGAGFSATQTRKLNSSDVQSAAVVGALSSPIVPVILALFICILLSVKLDYVVSNSIALPFLLWEAHHLWCNRHVIEATSRGVGGLLGLALVLCGVQQSIIRKMTQITTVLKCVFEDFSFYILTIVIWYWMIGLPGSVQMMNELPGSVQMMNEFTAPETVRVSATSEDDIFDNEEF